MTQIIKGTEQKFAINLTAPGFSMDTDDFEIEVASPSESLKGYKNPPAGASTDVIIFKETETHEVTDPETEEVTEETTSTWYAIVNTAAFTKIGDLRVIATAHIPDVNANDGIRNDIQKAALGTLINP